MRTIFFRLLTVTTIVSLFSSCLWDDKEVDYSSDPCFYSLKFAANDSIPGLGNAVFTLEFDIDLNDSVIVNLDSLPFQIRIDSVNPTFVFNSSSWRYLSFRDSLGTGVDSIFLTGKDTIDFRKVIKITNYAADGVAFKAYPIKVNVHQVAPELYVWSRKVPEIYTHSGSVQKVVFFKNMFFFYAGSATNNYLYTSDKALVWSPKSISGLPPNCNLRDITVFNDKLYLAHNDGKTYSSADGISWIALDPGLPGYAINHLLFVLDNNLWSVFKHQLTQDYYFSKTADGVIWQINEKLPANFPIADFGVVAFKSSSNLQKAIVVGGYDAGGKLLSSVWSVQKNINKEYKWIDFTKTNTATLEPNAGATVINYDDKLLLFGGMRVDGSIVDTPYMESIDEGLSWRRTDTIYNVIKDLSIPLVYQPRSYQSVVHDPIDHYIYLFGGKNSDEVFSDVWVGKLNRLSFAR